MTWKPNLWICDVNLLGLSVRGIPFLEVTPAWLSPCFPTTYACTLSDATPLCSAKCLRKREVSKEVPEPTTRFGGRPDHCQAAQVDTSRGFGAISNIACES
jgi:hypothetical protein